MTRYMGIDAGTRKIGFATLLHEEKTLSIVDLYHLRLDVAPWEEEPTDARLQELFRIARNIIRRVIPDHVLVEHIRVRGGGRNLDTYLTSARAQQSVALAAYDCGVGSIHGIMANQVRSRLNIRAKGRDAQKKATLAFVNGRFEDDLERINGGPLIGVQDDLSDAIALAMTGPAVVAGGP